MHDSFHVTSKNIKELKEEVTNLTIAVTEGNFIGNLLLNQSLPASLRVYSDEEVAQIIRKNKEEQYSAILKKVYKL